MKIGLQMFSLRDLTPTNMEGALKAAADAGYDSVEFAGFFNHTPEELREMTDRFGLTVYGTHTHIEELAPDKIEESIRAHKVLGAKNFTVPSYPVTDPAKLETFISMINAAQPVLEANGLSLHYHNHSTEFMNGVNYTVYDQLVERTALKFQIDTYHVFAAGLDPLEVLERYKDRISCIHLRDGLGYKLEARALGDGKAPVLACCRFALDKGWDIVVENASNIPSSSSEAKRCVEYLKKNFD